MLKTLRSAVALVAFGLFATAGHASTLASFSQSAPGVADGTTFNEINVSLTPPSGTISQYNLQINPIDVLAFGAIGDDLSDNGSAGPPQIGVLLSPVGGAPVFATSNVLVGPPLSYAPGILLPGPWSQVSDITGTSTAFPNDNVSSFSLFFAAAPALPFGQYGVAYSLGVSLFDPNTQSVSLARETGTFNVTIGPVAPVPLPAGGVLILTGLGAIGLLRRRQQRKV